MKHIKVFVGLLLILGTISGLIYWELCGREAVLTDQLLVAKETIMPGTVVDAECFIVAGIMEENKIAGALGPQQLPDLEGKTASQRIIKNAQIVGDYFIHDSFLLKDGQSIYVLKPEWISMRSSSLRRGDWIDIYEENGQTMIGTYQVAFVKDINEVEVRDEGNTHGISALDRLSSTSVIDHVEIITTPTGYLKILDRIYGALPMKLILVQRKETSI